VSDLEAESEHTVQVLVKQLNDKKLLIKKLKNTLLYKPSEDRGMERYWSQGPQLMLDYCWPVLHLHGVPENPINLKEFYFLPTEKSLSQLLQIRIPRLSANINMKASVKRKSLKDHSFNCDAKRARYTQGAPMLSYNWPVAVYNESVDLKRKFYEEVQPFTKRVKVDCPLDEFPTFYSYRCVNPTAKTTCLSSPGLCSRFNSTCHKVNSMRYLDKSFERNLFNTLNLGDPDNDLVWNSCENNDLTDYFNFSEEVDKPFPKGPCLGKIKCALTPGLCEAVVCKHC